MNHASVLRLEKGQVLYRCAILLPACTRCFKVHGIGRSARRKESLLAGTAPQSAGLHAAQLAAIRAVDGATPADLVQERRIADLSAPRSFDQNV